MNNEGKILSINDDLTLKDLVGKDELSGKKFNYIVVRDKETGEVLQVRKNLVVRKGREFNLRKIFHINYPGQNATNLANRHINLFGIGTAGTPASDPYSPYAPTPADAALSREVPFRSLTGSQSLASNEASFYTDERNISGARQYFKKTFTRKDIVMNDQTDDYYVKLVLDITSNDARGTVISELALFSSELSGNVYSNPIIATRVTFQSEPLSVETRKGLTIDYYVYS